MYAGTLTEDIFVAPQRRIWRERLLEENVQDRPGEVLVVQGKYDVALCDNIASANIDKSHLVTTSQNFSET